MSLEGAILQNFAMTTTHVAFVNTGVVCEILR